MHRIFKKNYTNMFNPFMSKYLRANFIRCNYLKTTNKRLYCDKTLQLQYETLVKQDPTFIGHIPINYITDNMRQEVIEKVKISCISGIRYQPHIHDLYCKLILDNIHLIGNIPNNYLSTVIHDLIVMDPNILSKITIKNFSILNHMSGKLYNTYFKHITLYQLTDKNDKLYDLGEYSRPWYEQGSLIMIWDIESFVGYLSIYHTSQKNLSFTLRTVIHIPDTSELYIHGRFLSITGPSPIVSDPINHIKFMDNTKE